MKALLPTRFLIPLLVGAAVPSMSQTPVPDSNSTAAAPSVDLAGDVKDPSARERREIQAVFSRYEELDHQVQTYNGLLQQVEQGTTLAEMAPPARAATRLLEPIRRNPLFSQAFQETRLTTARDALSRSGDREINPDLRFIEPRRITPPPRAKVSFDRPVADRGIAETEVILLPQTGPPVVQFTRPDGGFYFHALPGAFTLKVHKPGYDEVTQPMVYATIEGQIDGVVVLQGRSGPPLLQPTAADGSYTIENVAPGVYTLGLHRSGQPDVIREVRVRVPGTAIVGGAFHVTFHTTPLPGGVVLHVEDADHHPVTGAAITLRGADGAIAATLSTRDDGSAIQRIAAGDYEIGISAPGYKAATTQVTIPPGQIESVPVTLGR